MFQIVPKNLLATSKLQDLKLDKQKDCDLMNLQLLKVLL